MAHSHDDSQPQRVIRASEIGQYLYCARAWWLANEQGVPSSNIQELAQGEAAHRQHGRRVWFAGFLRALALALVILAVVMLLIAVAH